MFSESYQIKNKIEDKYLLIRGNRIKTRFIPVSGVYKYYDEAKPILEKMNFVQDFKMGNIDDANDLRINIKGKYLLSFLNWFRSMKDREFDPD